MSGPLLTGSGERKACRRQRNQGVSPDFFAVHSTKDFLAKMNRLTVEYEDARWQKSVYDELYRLAEAALARETPGHSLQPTLIVNDAYLRLLEQRNVDATDRSQVLAAGATIIRRLLVDYARQRKAQKRGGAAGRGVALQISLPDHANHIDILELADALEMLSHENQRAALVVELRFFGGLNTEDIAKQLGVSVRTVSNDWRYAKAWLYQTLAAETAPGNAEPDLEAHHGH